MNSKKSHHDSRPSLVTRGKADQLIVWRMCAADYFGHTVALLNTAQVLIGKLQLPAACSQFFPDPRAATPGLSSPTWFAVQKLLHLAFADKVIPALRHEETLFQQAVIDGPHSDLWLKEFAQNFSRSVSESQFKKIAQRHALRSLNAELTAFGRDMDIAFELRGDGVLVDADGCLPNKDRIYLQMSVAHVTIATIKEIVKALRKYEPPTIERAFESWAGTLTKDDFQYFEAREIPRYLALADRPSRGDEKLSQRRADQALAKVFMSTTALSPPAVAAKSAPAPT